MDGTIIEKYTGWLDSTGVEAFILKDNTIYYIACNDEQRGKIQNHLKELSVILLDSFKNGEYLDDICSALYTDYKVDCDDIIVLSAEMIRPTADSFDEKGINDLFRFLVENNCENKPEDALLVVFEINE